MPPPPKKLAPQEIRTYFVTTVTASRRRLFQVETNALLLIATLQEQRTKSRMQIHAFVVMPDHIHLLLTPAPETSLEKAMQYIKGAFSFKFGSKMDVWQRSYDSRRILAANDFADRLSYTEQNPVRAHISPHAEAYPFSSANKQHLTDPVPPHLT